MAWKDEIKITDTNFDTFCGEPFLGLSTRGIGYVQQCSQIKYIHGIPKKGTVDNLNINDGYTYIDGEKQELFNLKYDNWQDIWHSEYLVDLRDKMLKGIKNPTCELCFYQKENAKRFRYVKKFDHWNQYYNKSQPNKIELRLSNECNLACRMCTPINSSIYEKDILRIDRNNTEEYPDWFEKGYVIPAKFVQKLKKQNVKFLRDRMEQIEDMIDNATIIEIHGGEPTLEDKIWEKLDSIDLSNKELIMYSNAMKFEQYHVDILNRFKKGRVGFSLDVCDESIEYSRWPAKWNQIEKNVLQNGKQLKQDIEIHLMTTINVYTMFRIKNVLTWMFEHFGNDPRFKPNFNVVEKPAYLNPNIVDYNIRQELVKELKSHSAEIWAPLDKETKKDWNLLLDKFTNHMSIRSMYDSIPEASTIMKQFSREEIDNEIRKQFFQFTKILDKSRGQDFYTALPEFKGVLDE